MLKYKLICSDLDDTLITSEMKVTDGVKAAVKRYEAAGGRFCIVTGRMTAGVYSVTKELNLDTETATFQGAVITDLKTGETIYSQGLDIEKAAEIAKYIEDRGFYFQTYYGDWFVTEKANEYTKLYGKLCGAEYREAGEKLSVYIKKQMVSPPKILIMADPQDVPSFEAELKEKYGEDFRINTSKPFIIEIVPKGISKAEAVKFIADRHGIKIEDVICVGDSENDLPMIKVAGLGIAVGNASDYVKSVAGAVVADCDNGGMIEVIEKYGLIKEN